MWKGLIDKNTRKLNMLEHVLSRALAGMIPTDVLAPAMGSLRIQPTRLLVAPATIGIRAKAH